jgi:hypothetical protein
MPHSYPCLALASVVLALSASAAEPAVAPEKLTEAWSPVPPLVATPATGAPSDAIILFDGHKLDAWEPVKPDGQPWSIADGALVVPPGKPGDLRTKQAFGDVQLHVEWRTPADVKGDGQGRGNSGIFLMGLYEVQVLDSWRNPTYVNGQAGSVYKEHAPLVNAARPPGEWQAYDVVFVAPRFGADGKLLSPARLTVFHNGVLIQHDVTLTGPTPNGASYHQPQLPAYVPHAPKLPLVLQDHRNPVAFRNIWVRELQLPEAGAWRPLFNGRDLTGWDSFMTNPDPAWEVAGLKRDAAGKYLEPIGLNRDPLGVFNVETVDGEPALHVSGQGFGVITTRESFGNCRIRVQYKWGEKKWGSKLNSPRDAGLLYYVHGEPGFDHATWPRSIECQIQEHDTGDLFALGAQTTVNARQEGPRRWLYDPAGTPTLFVSQPPIGNRCIKLADLEVPHGEWNTLEVICFNGDSIHLVNGQVVMRLHHAQRLDGPAPAPLVGGQISLQTEGAELWYRRAEVMPIDELPAEFAGQ